jgi:hypothetical protein
MSKTKAVSRYILTFLFFFVTFALLISTNLVYLPAITASLFSDSAAENVNSISICYSVLFAVFAYYFLGKIFNANQYENRKTLIKNIIAVVLLFGANLIMP